MFLVYTLPYFFLTGFFGPLGGLLMLLVLLMGILRVLFLSVLLITGDMVRFKSEQTEGLSVVIAKIKGGRDLVKSWLKWRAA